MKKKTKRSFAIHHWCGLIAGGFLLVIGLTGSILVFDDDIDEAIFRHHKSLSHPAGQLSFDRSFEQIRANNPGWEIRIPEIPASASEAILYELRQGKLRKWIFAHPETGKILSRIDRADLRLTNTLLNIHYSMMAGTTGKIFVSIVGIAFLTLLITGFIIYRKSILKVLLFKQKVSFSSPRAMLSSLHRIVGVWGLFFNLLMCISGLWLTYLVVDNALKKKNTIIETPPLSYSIDRAIEQARDSFPDFEITYLKFPTQAQGKLLLLGRLNDDPAYYGKTYSNLQLNTEGKTGNVLLLKDTPMPMRGMRILQALHFGDYAGLTIKIIYVIGGLMPGLLSITGFLIWRKRRKPSYSSAILAQSLSR